MQSAGTSAPFWSESRPKQLASLRIGMCNIPCTENREGQLAKASLHGAAYVYHSLMGRACTFILVLGRMPAGTCLLCVLPRNSSNCRCSPCHYGAPEFQPQVPSQALGAPSRVINSECRQPPAPACSSLRAPAWLQSQPNLFFRARLQISPLQKGHHAFNQPCESARRTPLASQESRSPAFFTGAQELQRARDLLFARKVRLVYPRSPIQQATAAPGQASGGGACPASGLALSHVGSRRALKMTRSDQPQTAPQEASPPPHCTAELIFYAQTQRDRSEPVKVLGEYVCDFTRPDWEHRWMEWNSGLNAYLHLFLCKEHARKLGLIAAPGPSG
jgi:hypothetical protein